MMWCYIKMMRAADLDWKELLDYDPATAQVRFAGQRALIIDAVALGLLRKQLVDNLGMRAARALLTRFGFAHGWRMAEAVEAELTFDDPDERLRAGGVLHALQGMFRVEPGGGGPLSKDGATLIGSYEAEQHLLQFGRADFPVCWTLCGLVSGYLSRTSGRELYVLESRCVGHGDAACRFVGRTKEEWGDELEAHLAYFGARRPDGGPPCTEVCFDGTLHQLAGELKQTEQKLRQHKRALDRVLGRVRADEEPAGIVARSGAIQKLLDLARRVAKVDSTVLITGESGAGKERFARLVHDESLRATAPFIAVNCGAISETLLESELFGHARGAFTGATHDRAGLFEAASGGTLFLDEVGEVSPGMQVKLLRALQEHEIRRVGESKNRKVDVRVVAATNRTLTAEVDAGRFRKDLYYRLKVVELHVPALRDRREDILPLARVLLAEAATRMKRPMDGLSPRAADQLVRYAWPGNVRELENAMERAVALATGRRVELEDLPEEVRQALPVAAGAGAEVRPLDEVERDYILAALERNGGNQTRTAAQLGIGTATMYRKLKRYGDAE
jgi:DNA-binding NtrC family response regulator